MTRPPPRSPLFPTPPLSRSYRLPGELDPADGHHWYVRSELRTQRAHARRLGRVLIQRAPRRIAHYLTRIKEATPGFLLHKARSEEHTSELQSPCNLVCRLLL